MDPFVFRLMYKNQYSMSVTAMNIYMVILKSSPISEDSGSLTILFFADLRRHKLGSSFIPQNPHNI